MSDCVPGGPSVIPERWPGEGMTGGQKSLSPWRTTPVRSLERRSQCQKKDLTKEKSTEMGIDVKLYCLIKHQYKVGTKALGNYYLNND